MEKIMVLAGKKEIHINAIPMLALASFLAGVPTRHFPLLSGGCPLDISLLPGGCPHPTFSFFLAAVPTRHFRINVPFFLAGVL